MSRANAFETTLSSLTTLDDIGSAFEAEIKAIGYDYYDIGAVDLLRISEGTRAFRYYKCNYLDGEIHDYMPRTWPSGDPSFETIVAGTGPVDYRAVLQSSELTVTTSLQLGILNLWNIKHAWLMPYNTQNQARFVTVYMKGKSRKSAFLRTRETVFLLGSIFVARADAIFRSETNATTEPYLEVKLTREESACVKILITGASNPEIARQLGVSADTVRYHLKKVFRKMDVRSRTEVVAQAKRLGIEPDG